MIHPVGLKVFPENSSQYPIPSFQKSNRLFGISNVVSIIHFFLLGPRLDNGRDDKVFGMGSADFSGTRGTH